MLKVAIHSVPRSGSNWLGSIFDSNPAIIYKHQPLFSYKLKGYLNENSSEREIEEFYAKVIGTPDEFMDRAVPKRKKLVPVFKKNDFEQNKCKALVYKENRYHYILDNLLEKTDTVYVIGLIRNPLSVISSWANAPKEFKKGKGWEIEKEWRYASQKNLNRREEYFGYEKWKEATFLFERLQAKFSRRFCLLKYEDLLYFKSETVRNLFSFCQLDMHPQTVDYLNHSFHGGERKDYSVFKTKDKDDKWRRFLPKDIINSIMEDPDFIKLNKKHQWI